MLQPEFSLKILNNPVALLQASFSALVRVCMNCFTSLPNHVFMIGIFPSSLRSNASAWSTFAISILKFKNSICLLDALQLNTGLLIIGPACIGLHFSFGILLAVCGLAGRSASLIALTIVVAAWIAVCVIADSISYKFAFLLLFKFCLLSNFCLFQSLSAFEFLSTQQCSHGHCPILHPVSLANAHMHALIFKINACYKGYTHNVISCAHCIHVYIIMLQG